MKKVGIVSCYFKNNYGSLLQAYASKKILDNNNILNETIAIEKNKDFSKGKRKYYLSQIFNFNFIKSKFGMIKLKIDKKLNKSLGKNIKIRDKKYEEFKKEFNLSRSCLDYKGLKELAAEKYSDVIVGSDQLWLPVNVVADYYTLNWVPENINKISYATSFGVSSIPKKYTEQYSKFLKRINHLSVREESGVKLVKEITQIDAQLVCDPTILLTKEEWESISVKDRIIKDKYIFCYFLGSNIEHRKFAERLKKETGCKIVSLNHADEYVKYSDLFADFTPYDIGPKEWINLVKNAEYICTDSFHGTVFSILFNKTFFDFRRHNNKNKNSTNSRIDSLLNVAGISKDRILSGNEDIKEVLKYEIDYQKVDKNISVFREQSKKWLLDSIEWQKDEESKYIKITDKEMCSGCTACANICPKDAIEMVRDEEGFLYPKVNKDKCIDCGLCKKTCPMINHKEHHEFEQKAYIFQNKDEQIRLESTSGGAFTAIAEEIINSNGVVFGVAFDKDFKVKHTYATTKKELEKFRNSKYVQSDPNETFTKVKEFLTSGKKVLFSGTSCQIAGLKSFLKKDYENLLLVDVVCRAVPSPLMWEKYLEVQKKKYLNPKKIFFREKYHGYKYSNMSIYGQNKDYHRGIDSDPYLRAFFSNICDRPSCYTCKFKTQYRESDLTIWDCFNIENFNSKLDDDKGTTRILCHTKKGMDMVKKIAAKHTCEEINVKQALSDFNGIFSKVNYNSRKAEFVKDMNSISSEELFEKYFPDTIKVKLERTLRSFLLKTGLYKKIISFGKKIRKRT